MLLKKTLIIFMTFLFTTLSMVNTVRNSFQTETQATTYVSAEEVLPTENTPEINFISQTDKQAVETPTDEIMTVYTVPTEEIITVDIIPAETESVYIEKFPEVPHYFQQDYSDTDYGSYGTVGTHGCGITSLAMVLSYLLDTEILPDTLAEQYGHYNTIVGSDSGLFKQSAEDYGVTVKIVHHPWSEVVTALQNGQVVIGNASNESIFTNTGHFIVLYGITEDGKILVHDPNVYNYSESKGDILKDGFANGFDQKSLMYHCFPFWIYDAKDLDSLAAQAETE